MTDEKKLRRFVLRGEMKVGVAKVIAKPVDAVPVAPINHTHTHTHTNPDVVPLTGFLPAGDLPTVSQMGQMISRGRRVGINTMLQALDPLAGLREAPTALDWDMGIRGLTYTTRDVPLPNGDMRREVVPQSQRDIDRYRASAGTVQEQRLRYTRDAREILMTCEPGGLHRSAVGWAEDALRQRDRDRAERYCQYAMHSHDRLIAPSVDTSHRQILHMFARSSSPFSGAEASVLDTRTARVAREASYPAAYRLSGFPDLSSDEAQHMLQRFGRMHDLRIFERISSPDLSRPRSIADDFDDFMVLIPFYLRLRTTMVHIAKVVYQRSPISLGRETARLQVMRSLTEFDRMILQVADADDMHTHPSLPNFDECAEFASSMAYARCGGELTHAKEMLSKLCAGTAVWCNSTGDTNLASTVEHIYTLAVNTYVWLAAIGLCRS